jgi:hypothetical protein
MRQATVLATAIALSLTVFGCESAPTTAPDADDADLAALLGMKGPNPRPQVWADGELFQSIVTPATFKPTAGNFDELYVIGLPEAPPQRLISDSKPGDQDYNGGRWHVNTLKAGVNPDKYMNATGVADLDLSDFESQPVYFECPLLPRRGR